ncbi:MAG: polysaccharide deacetylase family protein [Rhodocyclaceae bacterium]|nr:polysaccharide deacetylase family protein [Rhodocyclaceae bacterium]
MPRPWRPTPLLHASVLAHLGAALGTAVAPHSWPLALAVLACNHGLLVWGGLWPRSTLLGPNLLRLPAASAARGEIALTFDDGPNPDVTPRVLDLLDSANAKASFFCIGENARRHPVLVREIVARGHSVENHTQRHPHHFSLLGPRAIEREIVDAQHTISDISGRAPHFFRAVAGLRNVFLEPMLARHDLTLTTWSHRAYDTRYNDLDAALMRLAHQRRAGDILLLHDGHPAITPRGNPLVLEVLPILLEQLRADGLKAVSLAQGVGPAVQVPLI